MAVLTRQDPWVLKTPPGTVEYTLYRDEAGDPAPLVCQVGSTTLRYHLRAIEDLHEWLTAEGDWVPLGAADEQKPATEGSVEAWGRSVENLIGGWYGLRKGYRGRFGMYLPPLLDELGLAELTHDARNTDAGAARGAGRDAARSGSPSMLAGCRARVVGGVDRQAPTGGLGFSPGRRHGTAVPTRRRRSRPA